MKVLHVPIKYTHGIAREIVNFSNIKPVYTRLHLLSEFVNSQQSPIMDDPDKNIPSLRRESVNKIRTLKSATRLPETAFDFKHPRDTHSSQLRRLSAITQRSESKSDQNLNEVEAQQECDRINSTFTITLERFKKGPHFVKKFASMIEQQSGEETPNKSTSGAALKLKVSARVHNKHELREHRKSVARMRSTRSVHFDGDQGTAATVPHCPQQHDMRLRILFLLLTMAVMGYVVYRLFLWYTTEKRENSPFLFIPPMDALSLM